MKQLMMSADQSEATLRSKLEALQCHFTWILDPKKNKLLHLRDKLVDIGTEEGNSWVGHIYNLRGFIQCKVDSTEDALSLFLQAAEAFRQMRGEDEGPWLVVNYGNLAWLHHLLGDQAESEAYLSKVDVLKKKYPTPSEDELHAELYAEKAWTLMKFGIERELMSVYFQKAIKMQPDMVEWNTSHVLCSNSWLDADALEKIRVAQEQDPENLRLAVYYLEERAKKGEMIADEARQLARKVLRNPVSSYSGLKGLLKIYRNHLSIEEAVDLAEQALEDHPEERYLKRCAALYYKWLIYFSYSRPEQRTLDRAISLLKEVISLYPHCSLMKKVDLANIHAKSNHSKDEAEQIYQELLKSELEPEDQQLLYNNYAKYSKCDRREYQRAIRYHMKVAAIPHQSSFRRNSIKILVEVVERHRDPMWGEVEEFLENLQEP